MPNPEAIGTVRFYLNKECPHLWEEKVKFILSLLDKGLEYKGMKRINVDTEFFNPTEGYIEFSVSGLAGLDLLREFMSIRNFASAVWTKKVKPSSESEKELLSLYGGPGKARWHVTVEGERVIEY